MKPSSQKSLLIHIQTISILRKITPITVCLFTWRFDYLDYSQQGFKQRRPLFLNSNPTAACAVIQVFEAVSYIPHAQQVNFVEKELKNGEKIVIVQAHKLKKIRMKLTKN